MISDLLSCGGGPRRNFEEGLKGKRNLSTSNASLPGDLPLSIPWSSPVRRQPLSSPLPLMRINSPTSRVVQLRKEESVDERIREVEQDREVTSQIQLNQSWTELKIEDDDIRPEMMETLPSLVAMTTVSTPFISPSSPVFSSRVRSRSLTPTSPSSSRNFTYRRSLSPVPLRPSSLCFQPQRKRQRNSELQEDMDISPTQTHPPAKRAVFQSPLTFSPCISPLSSVPQTTIEEMRHLDSSVREDPRIFQPLIRDDNCSRPAFNTQIVQFPSFTSNSYLSKGVGLSSDSTHNHQCVESAFLPFKKPCTTDCLPTHPSQNISPVNDSHFDSLPAALNPVTTIS